MKGAWAWAVLAALLVACEGGSGSAPAGTVEPALPTRATPTLAAEALVAADGRVEPAPVPVVAAAPVCGNPGVPGDSVRNTSTVDGERTYRVHVPRSYSAARPSAVVFNFHGSGRTALEQESYSALVPLADREGFILVSPQAAGGAREWFVAGVYGDTGNDETGFTLQALDEVAATWCVDSTRVFATGLSNGAEMASQLGCMAPQVFAAIAPVSGVVYQGCDGRPAPVLSFHGTEDWNIPFDGIRAEMEGWAAHNGCAPGPLSEAVSAHVMRESYSGCTGGADVVLYVVDGGGHTWPGAEDDAGGVGPTTHEISANEIIWAFFTAHARRD
jgi:polyhydroxybutyrate depolymerase